MQKALLWGAFFTAAIIGALILGFYSSLHRGFVATQVGVEVAKNPETASTTEVTDSTPSPTPSSTGKQAEATTTSTMVSSVSAPADVHAYTREELLAMAGDPFPTGEIPLGDDKYTTGSAKKGYVYLCNARKDNPGSMVNGPWIHGSSWNYKQKIAVQGKNSWPSAVFTNSVYDTIRVLSGNALPIAHTTGTFPVAANDPAYQYDANPNTISSVTIKAQLPTNPVYNKIPSCMGGEVGIMLTGVPLFNAFDAGLRDAPAHELQDSCDGHPQGTGEYHYHSLSSCIENISVITVIGYAYDGFPITGGKVADGKYLATKDLDECHGIVSDVIVDGKMKTTYHYVMTQDFPYSASCFRGKPTTTGPSAGLPNTSSLIQGGGNQPPQASGAQGGAGGTKPPQQAIDACMGKAPNASCFIQTPNGTLTGSCTNTQDGSYACVPR